MSAKKLITAVILATPIFVKGEMKPKGKILTVKDSPAGTDEITLIEAKSLIGREVAKDAADVAADDDNTKPLERMNKNELLEYAKSLEIEADESLTKAEITTLIKDFLDGEE